MRNGTTIRLTAERLAHALRETLARHQNGFMAYGTYLVHARSLWAQADSLGLTLHVNTLLGNDWRRP